MGQPESPAHLEHQNPKNSSWSWALLPQSHRSSVRMGFVRSEKMLYGLGEHL